MNAKVSRVWNERGTDGRREGRASAGRTSATSALGELVAGAPDREHELRRRRVVLDLVAQVAHVDVDRLLVLVERLVVAQELEQLAPAEDTAGSAGEVAQDLELGRGQRDAP